LQSSDLDYTNLFGGDIEALEKLLNPPTDPNPAAGTILNNIQNPNGNPLSNSHNHNALMVTSRTYLEINKHMLEHANVLPPSGGKAGVYKKFDSQEGVWKAPANVSIVGVSDITFNINHEMQEGLNVDILGKSINAIRMFPGMGVLVWGARTLDGNSLDWRYIPVRRTVTMLEQSCKLAVKAYVFEPNNRDTWVAIQNMISNFLTNIWKQGGLAGSAPEDAFSVNVGLGSTMTPEDIVEGILRVQIGVAVVRPAEFIILQFEQQMAKS
jgi:phage tail sheath protein FI